MLTGNLEYLMSSLPNLTFNNSEPTQHEVNALFQKYAFSASQSSDLIEILNEEALKYLSSRDIKRFRDIQLNTIHQKQFQDSKIQVASEFSKFMYRLKSEIKTYRSSQRSQDNIGKIQYELLAEVPTDPLKAEEYLLEKQWQKLEDLSIGHYSNLSALILYKLKLQLLARWWQFDKEIGFEKFQRSLNVA